MLNFNEKKILEIISEKLLIGKGELALSLGSQGTNGFNSALDHLKEKGFIDTVGGLGTSIVITQKGLRELGKV